MHASESERRRDFALAATISVWVASILALAASVWLTRSHGDEVVPQAYLPLLPAMVALPGGRTETLRRLACAGLLFVFCFLGMASIGLFFAPALVFLMLAAMFSAFEGRAI